MRVKDWKTNKEYVGHRIAEHIYPNLKEMILALHRGQSLLLLVPTTQSNTVKEKPEMMRHCVKCNALITSASARYCGLCGAPLKANCPSCGKEMSLEYSFCLNCGKRLE